MMVTKELIQAYFAGQATPLQKKMIADWLKQQPSHREMYFAWLEEWERRVPQYAPDIDKAIDRFRQRADQATTASDVVNKEQPAEVRPLRRTWIQNWLWAASAILVVGVLGYMSRGLIQYKTYATDYGQTYTFTLPDSSAVTLNGHSELRIPRFGFGESTRRVSLSGEAVFDVRHTVTNQRFLVETPDKFEVVVLGTEFSVTARPQGTKVALNRGKVQLRYRTDNEHTHQLLMKPGDWVSLTKLGEVKRGRHEHPKEFAAWRDHQFVFDKTPLSEIVAMVKETYGLTVRLAGADLAERTVSGSYLARTSDDLIKAVAEILELQITRSGKTLTLSSIPPK